jgi:NAD(P)H-hydrate epimerase
MQMANAEIALYRCEHIRFCERQAIQTYQYDDHQLMAKAGEEAFLFLRQTYPHVKQIAVYCGAGNNAGDGYVLARLAHEHGLSVVVYQCKAIDDLPGAAKNAALMAAATGVDFQSADEVLDSDVELIVDALLGIGLKGAVQGTIANAIIQINASHLPIIALDIPSGLNADTGYVENLCVKASHTITFIALKAGLYTMDAPDYCGHIHCASLGLDHLVRMQEPVAYLLNETAVHLPLMARKKNSHKGQYGHVLIIGGGEGMPGAVSLAAKAALRTGAGAVTIATWPEHVSAILPLIPEAMIWGVQSASDLTPLLARASVCVIGPGLGESPWAKKLFTAAITSQLPMVIDASGLRLLAEHPQWDDNWILTPHPGEAACLLSCSAQVIQTDRYRAAATLQQQYGGIIVLKGCGTLIQTPADKTSVCPQGNPGMATAGMGDVLSGVIAGLCAQGFALADAARMGVWVHAQAGDQVAAILGSRGLLAGDLIPHLPHLLNGI